MDLGATVSCLMVTRAARMEMAKRAVECFRRQSYPNKELVVVSQDDVSDLGVPFHLAPVEMTLGDLRNFAIARAKGAFVAQWDDDDWYHPWRLDRQLETLRAAPAAVGCTLARWTMAWPAKDRYVVSGLRTEGFEGSILARRGRLPPYPALARGEDSVLMRNIRLVTLDEPDLYIYQVHYANTWAEEHFDKLFAAASQTLSAKEAEIARRNIGA